MDQSASSPNFVDAATDVVNSIKWVFQTDPFVALGVASVSPLGEFLLNYGFWGVIALAFVWGRSFFGIFAYALVGYTGLRWGTAFTEKGIEVVGEFWGGALQRHLENALIGAIAFVVLWVIVQLTLRAAQLVPMVSSFSIPRLRQAQSLWPEAPLLLSDGTFDSRVDRQDAVTKSCRVLDLPEDGNFTMAELRRAYANALRETADNPANAAFIEEANNVLRAFKGC